MRVKQSLQKLQQDVWNLRKRNSGSSIVIVIIAMAMIGILATTLLWMSYYSYKIKVNDIKNKNSFYSAETVLEQIIAGLQNEAATAMGTAYKNVLSNWEDYEGSETNRYSAFADIYLKTLMDDLGNGSNYKREELKKYVDDDIWKNVDENRWNRGTDDDLAQPLESVMELANGNSLILRNLCVSYLDPSNQRVSVICTDIRLDVPYIVFEQSVSVDRIYDYTLIGDQGIIVRGGGNTTVAGSIYAGITEKTEGEDEDNSYLTDGIHIKGTSKLNIEHAKYVISKGDIIIGDEINGGTKAGLSVRSDQNGNSLYTNNLDVNGGTLNLEGETYVANDLELYGNGSKATIANKYYGYGDSKNIGINDTETQQENSSSIIVNGANATIDMTKVRTLMLAGRAYIGKQTSKNDALQPTGSSVPESSKNKEAVLMGESITVKGGQIAYLVPTECIGVKSGEVIVGQNPVTLEQLSMMEQYKQDSESQFREVDFYKSVSGLNGKSLADFGVTDMSHIRKVGVSYPNESNKKYTYYYLVMEPDKAAEYFNYYYSIENNKNQIDRYFNKYASGGIMLGDRSLGPEDSYTIMGNALVSQMTEDGNQSIGEVRLLTEADAGSTVQAMTDEEVNDKIGTIKKTVENLTTNLSEDGGTSSVSEDGEPPKTVFENIMRETELNNFLRLAGDTVEFETDSDNSKIGIVTAKENYKLSEQGRASDVRLIISTGKNVTIDKNFKGIVICKGTITVESGTATDIRNRNYVSNSNTTDSINSELYSVLNAEIVIDEMTYSPLYFFVNGTKSLKDEVFIAPTNKEGYLDIDYSKIVRYVNWEKR